MKYLKIYELFEKPGPAPSADFLGVNKALLPKSASEAESKLKDSKFLAKKRELIEYLTNKNPHSPISNQRMQPGFDMTSREPGLADITEDGVMDTEMMTFKKDDLVIHSGVTYYSNGDIKYITTVRNRSGEVILEPFISKNIEELDRALRPVFKH